VLVVVVSLVVDGLVVSVVVIWLDVVLLVVVADVVVFVLVDVRLVLGVGDGTLGSLECEFPPPQCWALPLLPSLPQLPLLGFPPFPGLFSSVSTVSVFSPALAPDPPLPSESVFGPLPASFECGPRGTSEDDEGSAMARAPPKPHRNRPDATMQADAAPSTREPTSPPLFTGSPPSYSEDPTILAQPR
jgi:hypothetical protein